MSRQHIQYGDMQGGAQSFHGFDASVPVAGHYRFRLHGGAVRGGVRIWFGAPSDPITGEIMDRHWRWQAEFDGEYIELDEVWPVCAKSPISAEEYRAMVSRKKWAEMNAPASPYADRRARYDPLSTSTPMPF